MTAVSNSGPLIHLSWIGRLELLPTLFGAVVVPSEVYREVLLARPAATGVRLLSDAFRSDWLRVQSVADHAAVAALRAELDAGEAEAIVLMREVGGDVLLLDERRGRAVAQRLGLRRIGTIGILQLARSLGLIPRIAPVVDELRRRGFRISADIVDQIKREEPSP